MSDLTARRLREILDYNPQTGVFTWLTSIRGRRDVGKQAGYLDTSNGHIRINVEGKRYYASHLAFLHMIGKLPTTPQVDHRNNKPADDSWTNLRSATCSQNLCNTRVKRIGLKGVKPVGFRFRARIHLKGKEFHLGYFATEVEAHEAYRIAAIKFHGEFANFG